MNITLKIQHGGYYSARANGEIVGVIRGHRESGWTFRPTLAGMKAGFTEARDTSPRRAAAASSNAMKSRTA